VRGAGRVTRRIVLAVGGGAPAGHTRVRARDLAASERQEAGQQLREGLGARGLEPPLAGTIAGGPGLRQALAAVWPKGVVQRCLGPQLRTLRATAPRHAPDAVRDAVHAIGSARSAAEAATAYEPCEPRGAQPGQRGVERLREGGKELLTVVGLPQRLGKGLRTTHGIARLPAAVRRRVQPQAALPNEAAVLILRWGRMARGPLRRRRIDGWQGISAVMAARVRQAACYPRLRPHILLDVSRLPDFPRTRDTTPDRAGRRALARRSRRGQRPVRGTARENPRATAAAARRRRARWPQAPGCRRPR
jgi:transposase-like protein